MTVELSAPPRSGMSPAAPEVLTPADCPRRLMARLTIELRTPMHIGTGRGHDGSDAGFVLDASGLPSIPGSGTAGMLRDALRRSGVAEPAISSLLGCQGERTGPAPAEGQGSRLNISWAVIHGADNLPVCVHLSGDAIVQDAVLLQASRPPLRDHVRLHGGGAAAFRGKFDERIVSPRHRFTLELEMLARPVPAGGSEDPDGALFERVLAAFADPRSRFGGRTRRGFGAFRLVALYRVEFDLSTAPGLLGRARLDPDFCSHADWLQVPAAGFPLPPAKSGLHTEVMPLLAPGFWMFGGGADPTADLTPVTGPVILWQQEDGTDRGTPGERLLIPGTGIKGPLRHRTLYHACIASGYTLDQPVPEKLAAARALVETIFGSDPESRERPLRAGQIWIDDIYQDLPADPPWAGEQAALPPHPRLQHHIATDRLTGGVNGSALFDEMPAFAGGFTCTVSWLADLPGEAIACLRAALADLAAGRLPLGAGAGRGLGHFQQISSTASTASGHV